ncbi:hypothetical protein HA402_011000 [Bradysia odoriphaga]|nr:hypothetical protein HA402_011000 [Bradysia odoriphaga]
MFFLHTLWGNTVLHYAFGKCLPKYGTESEQDELEREPLNEEQSHILSTMLEELQGAGLGWDHLFVQCRMQGALFSLRNSVPMPPNLCANLAPDPQVLDPQSPLAFVRFQPPDDAYADEVYFPPDKKGFDDRLFLQPLKSIQPQKKLTSHRLFGSPFDHAAVPYKRSDYLENAVPSEEIENRIKDIKNRIELRKMLAEYESGQLKPPIYYQQDIFENSANEEPAVEDYLLPNMKRVSGQFDAIDDDDFQDDPLLDESPKTSFREMSRELHIPKVDLHHPSSKSHRHSDPKLQDAEETNELPLEPLKLNAMRYFDESNNNSTR